MDNLITSTIFEWIISIQQIFFEHLLHACHCVKQRLPFLTDLHGILSFIHSSVHSTFTKHLMFAKPCLMTEVHTQ